MNRAPCAEWPRILNPAPGCAPPITALRRTERVLNLTPYPETGPVPSLSAALGSIAVAQATMAYVGTENELPAQVYAAAQTLRPTLIFGQLQHPTPLADIAFITGLREVCDPRCVIVQWNGDYRPDGSQVRWFVDLGRIIDCSLSAETQFQSNYAAVGVRHPGFFASAADERWSTITPPQGVDAPPIVLLASHGVVPGGYDTRYAAIASCAEWYGPEKFGLYGYGWSGNWCARPYLSPAQELGAYRDARAALSISVRNDVARLTSVRLFSMLYAGALAVVERFPDCEGMGLVDGENCMLWSGTDELHACLERALVLSADRSQEMRAAAKRLAREQHTWSVRMAELLAIIDAVRSSR